MSELEDGQAETAPHPADQTEQHGYWANGRLGVRVIPRIRRCVDCTCETRAEALMCLAGRSGRGPGERR